MENKQNVSGPKKMLEFKVNIGFLSSRYAGSGSFMLAVLLFFLPFISFKCKDVKIGHVTGVQAALHLAPTYNDEMYKDILGPLNDLDKFDDASASSKSKKRADRENKDFNEGVRSLSDQTGASICLPIAFFLGIIGVVLLLLKKTWAAMGGILAGWFAVGIMVFCAFRIIAKVKSSMSGAVGVMGMGSFGFTIGPTLWYYITIAFFALAAWLSYRLYQTYKADEQQRMVEEVMAQYPVATETTAEQTDPQI